MADPVAEFDGRPRADLPRVVFGMMAVLVTATIIAILYLAREVFVPITLAILLSFLLAPAVRLLRSILAYEIARSRALLIEVGRRLRRLVAGLARSTLHQFPGLSHRLSAGIRSLARQCGGARLGVLDHRLALLERALHARARLLRGIARHRANLLRRVGHAVLNSLLVHPLLQRE